MLRSPGGIALLLLVAALAAVVSSGSRLALAEPVLIPAFPGAEGFGADSVGGRGGKVIEA